MQNGFSSTERKKESLLELSTHGDERLKETKVERREAGPESREQGNSVRFTHDAVRHTKSLLFLGHVRGLGV
jgi:hypothetical protein